MANVTMTNKSIIIKQICITFIILILSSALQAKNNCAGDGVWLQVLGSGGPELNDGRASSGYVIWYQGKARILIDMGAGSLQRFEQSGASLNDLQFILMSHFHVDHSNDLPALIKASFFSDRKNDLPVYGPTGNRLMPSTGTFVERLLGPAGAYKYLSSYLDGTDTYRLLAHDVNSDMKNAQVIASEPYRITAVAVHHGVIPALAWRVDINGKSIVFSGDMNNDYKTLAPLAEAADLLVAHHAISESASGVARNLHMPPSVIGRIAAEAKVKQLLLSHRMNRTLGKEPASEKIIRRVYSGPVSFVDDLQCFKP